MIKRRTQPDLLMTLTMLVLWVIPVDLASAALPPEKHTWLEVRTPNFVIIGDAPERRLRDAGNSSERLLKLLEGLSAQGAKSPVPTFLYAFKSRESYEPYGLWYDGKPIKATGYFMRRQHANFMVVVSNDFSKARETVQHELTHYVMSYAQPEIPLWLNEGIAEFYSTFEVSGGTSSIGKHLPNHLNWLLQNGWIPIRELFRVDHGSPLYNESDRRGVFYSQSWLLTHYLLLGSDDGAVQLAKFLDFQRNRPMEQAFLEAFERSPEELEKELSKYLKSPRFKYRRVKVPKDDLKDQMVTRSLSRAEVLAHLGELLATQRGRRADAEEHLQAALDLDPDSVRARVGMALLTSRSEKGLTPDYGIPLGHLAVAKQVEPENAMVDLLSLQIRSQRGDAPKYLIPGLIKLINGNPNLIEGWRLLAWALGNSRSAEDLPNQILAFEGALRLMPERTDYAEQLLGYYRQAEQHDKAERLVEIYFRPRGLEVPSWSPQSSSVAASDSDGKGTVIEYGEPEGAERYAKRRRASELMGEEKYAEALELYEELLQEAPEDPSLVTVVKDLREAVAHNRFIEGYNRAIALFNSYRWAETIEVLETLRKTTTDSSRLAKVDKLMAQAQEQQRRYGT